jgi:23S rRNA G2445 N2-methylase RlmL
MKGIIITHPGLEDVSVKEVKELIKADCTKAHSVVVFEASKMEDFCTLGYRSQSALKVIYLLHSCTVKDMDDLVSKAGKVDVSEWIKDTTFCVRSKILDSKIDSMELEREVGAVIYEKYKAKVDLENPIVTFFGYVVGNEFYFGIDFTGFELSKRNYRIFGQSDSIKGTVAYALVRISGYKNGDIFLDPFSHSGTIALEAAFFASKKPINFYNKDKFAFLKFPQMKDFDFEKFFAKNEKIDDVKGITSSDSQQRNVKSGEKNAKIAGLNKQINFTRLDIEWLDTKFEKGSIEIIVSNPPKISRLLTEKGFDKVFQEFFYTADFILKSTGKIVLLAKNYKQVLAQAQRYNFTLKSSFPIWQGKEEFNILIFQKVAKK